MTRFMVVLFILITNGWLANCFAADVGNDNTIKNSQEQVNKVGGWYPIFIMSKDDLVKLNNLSARVKLAKIKNIVINYDENLALAKLVKTKLQNCCSTVPVFLNHDHQDDGSAKFNHKLVVVIVTIN